MFNLLKYKCLLGYLWTSAIAAGVLSIIFFTFIDPVHVANMLELQSDTALYEVKIYAWVFCAIWFSMNTSTYLAYYFGQLVKKMEREEQQQTERGKSVNDSHLEIG
ncbi:MAG: hypothetical protein AB2597_03030 [Candidatus Thiodiazotropha sp.]|nr:MAG: hypothetical protein DBO99_01525 [gamma proteobacterium symbiont of Ctena orbiculata]